MKSLYRHKPTGDLFALETDEQGNILSTDSLLLCKDIINKVMEITPEDFKGIIKLFQKRYME